MKKFCSKIFLTEKYPSLIFIGKDSKNNFEDMLKKSFKLPLVKDDLKRSLKARLEYNLLIKESFSMEDFKETVKSSKEKGKNILLYFSKEEENYFVNDIMRFVSNIENINEKILIYKIDNAKTEVLDYLKVKNFPSLFLIRHEYENKSSIKKIPFHGNSNKNNLWKFLDVKIFLENNLGVFKKEENELLINPHYDFLKKEDTKKLKNIQEAKSVLDFRRNCIHSYKGHCIIILLNGEINQIKKTPNFKIRKQLNLVNSLIDNKKINDFSNFYFVNGTCHDEVANSFRISKSKLPGLVFLNTQYMNFEYFSNDFKEENIIEFIEKMKNKRILASHLDPTDIKFEFKKCHKIFEVSKEIDFEKLDRIKYGLEDEEFEEEDNTIEEESTKKEDI